MKTWFLKLGPKMQIVLTIVGLIVAWIVFKKIREYLQTNRNASVDWSNIPEVGQTEDGKAVIWKPDALAKEIFEKVDGVNFFYYPETINQIATLQTDDQVKLLYNYYNQKYAKATLTKDLEAEWATSYKPAISRLKGLGLN